MPGVHKRTFSLTEAQAKYVDEKVASGAFASGSEVIREGLRSLQLRDAAIEKWLREEVVPTLEDYEANPESALSVDEVFDSIEAHIRSMEDAKKAG
ncbi:MAG: type II toxin-antitoxin system ParD family antitoxin [Alphaproteobacteria bacterium]|nr:type II toxin-antitoxin system ParD family antitoxin [Alphaproteobacteria bacterium]